MKNCVVRAPRDVISQLSPKSRKIRKSSEERKEKEKVETKLRALIGSNDESSQLELVLAAIAHIRELQAQLNGKENSLPDGLEEYFASCSTSPASSRASTPPTTSNSP
ncbi:unnamed protein product [Caenorhabditis angaria]|uniref:BHLH domain-containing protein n=1 Tax=Caenorhabditis angaria TaxID=860376 RepID=A0A9P1IU37_9PELO|nr:unnamed protein product [Caenorhabditis angaria]